MFRVLRRPAGVLALATLMLPVGGAAAYAAMPPKPSRAITTMWLWGNSVDPAVDARGRGIALATPREITDFAVRHTLRTVHVNAPWAADSGPVATWLSDTVTRLKRAGIDVGVLGGDPGWIDDPQLAVQWMTAATNGRAVSYVRLDVEPWTRPDWQADPQGSAVKWLAMIDAVDAAMPAGVDLSVDLPWWLTTVPNPEGSGTLAEAVLTRVDRIGIITFVDHASGDDGIIALSKDAVAAADAAGVSYTIGLETETPEVAGGSRYTFYDEGATALESEAAKTASAYRGHAGFRGVAVEHYLAWRALIDRGTSTTADDGLG